MVARPGVITALLCLLLALPAQAQQYQRLHVRSLTLTSDSAHPQIEQPFHVTLTIRVAEKQFNDDNVYLPSFDGAEELGDLRDVSHDAKGTTYRETLTLVAHAQGTLTVSNAYLDAIDARDGKPKRFISNSLTLPVGGGAIAGTWRVLWTVLLVGIEVLLVAAAVFVLAVLFWRRRKTEPLNDVMVRYRTTPSLVEGPHEASDELEQAWQRLGTERDRASVLHLRGVLWARAGADPGATLNDVLRRSATGDGDLRRLLTLVERAAFVEEARLDRAIEEVLCSPR